MHPPTRHHPHALQPPAAAPLPCRVGTVARCRAVASPTGPSSPGVAKRPEADVVVIRSGLGGLCCAGLLARYGQDVVVLESHNRPPGGAAHSFDVKGSTLNPAPRSSPPSSPEAPRPTPSPMSPSID